MAKPVANILASSSSRHVPKTGHVIGKRPVAGKSATHSPPSKVCFTFRFWRQIKFFGLSGKEASWFVALINKLQQFSDETIDAFTSDSRKHDVMRYHKVNWGQCNIPIQRSDLEWLPKNYLNNEEEFPIYQFSISQGQGRIAGFWDENKIFNIVLLDPYHNLQPVKKYDYKVTPTVEQLGEHELLVAR